MAYIQLQDDTRKINVVFYRLDQGGWLAVKDADVYKVQTMVFAENFESLCEKLKVIFVTDKLES